MFLDVIHNLSTALERMWMMGLFPDQSLQQFVFQTQIFSLRRDEFIVFQSHAVEFSLDRCLAFPVANKELGKGLS